MLSKIVKAKHSNKINRLKEANPVHKDKVAFNRRHYLGGTGNYTLYQGGASTAFPYAYGSIPISFNAYVTSVTMTANKYSSYGTPTGTSATVRIYKNDHLTQIGISTLTYTPSEHMRLTCDFAENISVNADDKIWVRWQSNGIWRYVDSTVILTER